jgi:hypothetical protein
LVASSSVLKSGFGGRLGVKNCQGAYEMATERANNLHAFKSFIDQQLAGESVPTVDEVIARWEYENESDEEREDALEAIRRGLADVDAGRTRPFEEFDRDFRSKHGLPPRS